MVWNPSPEVAVARDAAKKLNAQMCVVVFIDEIKGELGFASYGATKGLCAKAGLLGRKLYDATYKWYERDMEEPPNANSTNSEPANKTPAPTCPAPPLQPADGVAPASAGGGERRDEETNREG